MNRTLIIGDIHGCFEELKMLLDKLNYDPTTDIVCHLGDLTDRGPYSAAVVRFARMNNFKGTTSNHDEKHVRYWRHEQKRNKNPSYKNPMGSFAQRQDLMEIFNSLTEEDFEYLSGLPPYIAADEKLLLVHAGFSPTVPLDRQRFDIMTHIRYVDETTHKMIPLRKDFVQPQNSYYWAERWPGPQSVVYGHNVHSLENIRVDEPSPSVKCYGIDTGACFGGRLSCVIYPTMEVVQVQAKRQYYTLSATA